MVRVLDSGSSGPGSGPGWGHHVVLCSWARHFTLIVPLSTMMYKWVLAKILGVTLRWTSIPSRGQWKYSQSFHAMETRDKRWPDGPFRLVTET